MKKARLQLETLTCPSCMQKIEGALKKVDGVDKQSINVGFNTSRVTAQFDKEQTAIEQLEDAITRVGYKVLSSRVR